MHSLIRLCALGEGGEQCWRVIGTRPTDLAFVTLLDEVVDIFVHAIPVVTGQDSFFCFQNAVMTPHQGSMCLLKHLLFECLGLK